MKKKNIIITPYTRTTLDVRICRPGAINKTHLQEQYMERNIYL